MSELTFGVRKEEVVRHYDHLTERHIASGSGFDGRAEARGGGRVPARNPWREDPAFANPAQDGIGLLPYKGPPDRGAGRS